MAASFVLFLNLIVTPSVPTATPFVCAVKKIAQSSDAAISSADTVLVFTGTTGATVNASVAASIAARNLFLITFISSLNINLFVNYFSFY